MSFAKPNRFAKADAERQQRAPSTTAPTSGVVGLIDVHGAVERDADGVPRSIDILAARTPVIDGTVQLGSQRYQLTQLQGRDVLVPI